MKQWTFLSMILLWSIVSCNGAPLKVLLINSIAPAFHFTMDTCSNGEVYNMIIRGGNEGGLDGIDVWGTNIYIHDVEVTNKDECVTVKSPASDMLIENIYCNWSGGCAMGSLGADTGTRPPPPLPLNLYFKLIRPSNLQHNLPKHLHLGIQPVRAILPYISQHFES